MNSRTGHFPIIGTIHFSIHNNDFSGNTILKNTLEKVHGEFDGTLKETEAAKE